MVNKRDRSWDDRPAMPIPLVACFGALLLVLTATIPGIAEDLQIARVDKTTGQATVQRGAVSLPIKSGDPLYVGDVIATGASGSIDLTFRDSTTFSTGPNSELSLRQFRFEPANSTGEMLAEVNRGTLSVMSGKLVKGSPGAMKIKTPTAVLNVRGTTFLVKVD